MSRLTVTQLTEALVSATDIFRGKTDTLAKLDVISGVLLLKWASDNPDILHLPDNARWSYIVVESKYREPGRLLNEALKELTWANPDALQGVLEALDFSRVRSVEVRALIEHFEAILLSEGELEFSDVVGCAYDRVLAWFADRSGKMGGEFSTPRSVVHLMIRLVRPEPGQSIYDPFVGSGGTLVHAKEYIDEHHGKGAEVVLSGQDINTSAWSIARLNLLLHGISNASVLYGDSLTNPLHKLNDGQLRRFDRAVTNPPFSMDYVEKDVSYPERMKYGSSQKADLMNVQHVLAMLHPDGVGAVVTPHGVLFRGGAEAKIRRGIVEDGRLEAVIGIGSNVFYGTAIPACILVLRGSNGLPGKRCGSVLFINAEREVVTARTQNYLAPQHVEKIVNVFRDWAEIPGFSRAVSLNEIAANGFDIGIRRYVQAGTPAEPLLDVRAALFGGVPRRLVSAEASRFHVFDIDPTGLFNARDPDYLEFLPESWEATAERIHGLAAPSEQKFLSHCGRWWEAIEPQIVEVAGTERLMTLRSRLMRSFTEELLPAGILDQYQLAGVFAAWWSDHHDDLKSLDQRGFPGVIDRWTTSGNYRCKYISGHLTQERVIVLLGEDLCERVKKLVAAERRALVDLYRSWVDKYAASLEDLEEQCDEAAGQLWSRLSRLGYV